MSPSFLHVKVEEAHKKSFSASGLGRRCKLPSISDSELVGPNYIADQTVARYSKPENFSIVEIPLPELRDDDVLVKVKACGVCGTDLVRTCPDLLYLPKWPLTEQALKWPPGAAKLTLSSTSTRASSLPSSLSSQGTRPSVSLLPWAR